MEGWWWSFYLHMGWANWIRGDNPVRLLNPGGGMSHLFGPSSFLKWQVKSWALSTPHLETTDADSIIWYPCNKLRGVHTSRRRTCFVIRSAHKTLQGFVTIRGKASWVTIPPKVKHFIWRLCNNCLPARVRLRDKGVQCTTTPWCMCNEDGEMAWHSLISCPRSKRCWELIGFWELIYGSSVSWCNRVVRVVLLPYGTIYAAVEPSTSHGLVEFMDQQEQQDLE